ncbi:unnamed protein product [Trichobilharzia regenti]|nr:unnamed protein product [Trichobilharzia regenti]
MLNPYSDPPIKCGLYQIRLVGTMNINTDYLSDRSNSLSVISLPGRLYELPEMVNTSQSINANYYKKFEPTNFKYSGSYNQPQKSSFDDSSRRLDIIKSQNTIHRRMIFKEINRDSIPGYLVYLFDTPQCQYHRLPSGDIQINEENALAQISLTSGKQNTRRFCNIFT